MNQSIPKLEDLLSAMPLFGGPVPLEPIVSENRELLKEIASCDPLRIASTFSGLLAVPDLQSNCVRLETLVHCTLAFAWGRRKPSDKIISRLFVAFGKGFAGRCEDPAEDVFVSSIATPRGNFRVLEGIWESAGFYLQRAVNVLECLPSGGIYDHMRESVYALLQLSDAVCERAQLTRYQLGNEIPVEAVPEKLLKSAASLRRLVKFSEADLGKLKISQDHLANFGFRPTLRSGLGQDTIGHSMLERFPLAHRNGKFFFLLPTATSAAIRRYIFEQFESLGLRETLTDLLAQEYSRLFSETPLLGQYKGAPIQFQRTEDGLVTAAMRRIDSGLYLNLIFFMEDLHGFEKTGLIGTNLDAKKLGEKVGRWIDEAYEAAAEKSDFHNGLTLVIGCGIGRGCVMDFATLKERENWRFEFLSPPDLLTLSWLPDFKPLSLWRLLESREKLAGLGIKLQNINGLLNLVAWARSLGGHLVPHGDVPEEFGKRDSPAFIMIEQNALRDVRHLAAAQWDPHAVLDIQRKWVNVRKDGPSLFEEDRATPFYVTEQVRAGRWPRAVYETPLRPWWCELETTEGTTGHWAFERSMMLKTWVSRAVPVLEPALPGLPSGPVLLRAKFEGHIGDREGGRRDRKMLSFEDAEAALEVSADATTATVSLIARPRFEETIFHPENIAERALVQKIVEGFFALAGQTLPLIERNRLVTGIVPDSSARQSHNFVARKFRDFVMDAVPRSPVIADSDDSALIKLGLGWRVRDRAAGGYVRGKDACTRFLNDIVRLLEDELCEDLQRLDRHTMILRVLENHESAILEEQNWIRTAAALLSLHRDKEAALERMAEHQFELNGVFKATRLLVEFAICECPLEGGRKAGVLDLSKLMAKVLMIAQLGGWSDAIRWEAMQPLIRVTPLGDIHTKLTFQEEVLAPFARVGSDLKVQEGVRSYPKNLEDPEIRATSEKALPPAFWEAWQEEFGASLDDTRKFVDFVENLAIDAGRAVLKVPRSQLANAKFDDLQLAPKATAALINSLTFRCRARWRNVPEGYDEKDRHPWRFRRRLSVLRKPLIQIDDVDDPTIIVAPGILRDAFAYMLSNYYRGDFPLSQLKPKMKRWAGKSRDRIGREFNQSVAKRLGELGWKTQSEIKITKLLRRGFEKDYGDIDVLAWNESTCRVLLIECKDVQYRKTDGEIAEQLRDFHGELGPDGKPDLLLKHLNRVKIVSEHIGQLMKYIGFSQTPHIESHLVFKNPVPMQFAWERMAERVTLHILDGLDI